MLPIQNLLIDLGDVLYAIDLNRSIAAWQAMAPSQKGQVLLNKEIQDERFYLLDKGQISIEDLADSLIRDYQLQGSREQVIQAWDALLIGVIPGRVAAMEQLAQRYRLALLSNTNFQHYTVFKEETAPLFQHFDHLFLSFEMGLRKPDAAIYETALATANWKAEETLFLDDSLKNIEGARAVGLQTVHIAQHADFDRVFEELMR